MQPTPLAALWRPWSMIVFSIRLHWETLRTALRTNGLTALTHLRQIRDAASAKLFSVTCTYPRIPITVAKEKNWTNSQANDFIAYENTTIVPALVRAATGRILDLGPGPGNQIHRFDGSAVGEKKVERYGLKDKYKLIICGVEDSDVLIAEGVEEGSLDTVLCIQVLCAVKDPRSVMRGVYKLLKPGGRFIFWEHGWSRYRLTRFVQAFWNPAWSTFVGCHLTRDVLADILNAGEWENPQDVEHAGDAYTCLPRIQGVLVKKA